MFNLLWKKKNNNICPWVLRRGCFRCVFFFFFYSILKHNDFTFLFTGVHFFNLRKNSLILCFPQVPTKKLKKFEKEYQSVRESQLQQEDPIDRYQVRQSLFNLYLLWSSSSPATFIFISLCLSSGLCNGPHWKPQTLYSTGKEPNARIVDACFCTPVILYK